MKKYTKEEFNEKELYILRDAVDKAEERAGKRIANSPEIITIIKIVEDFIKSKKLICYGGTAINNILPQQDQFYNKNIEIPDYDFFSPNALHHAKELADIYYSKGYSEVEAKAGVHTGTYKVYVNFIPVADITFLEEKLFKAISMESIHVNGIMYAPPNFLRMSMYLELSRPEGDVSRWEKVLKRLILLNKHYPLKGYNCEPKDFARKFENDTKEDSDKLYYIIRNSFIDQGLVFFGSYAISLYSKYMGKKEENFLKKYPDFDILSEDPARSAEITKERLKGNGVNNVTILKKSGFGEIIAPHYEIIVDNDTVAFIYKPLACHSYNNIKIKGRNIKVATIDTILSFYLAFYYSNRPYYDKNRLLCMAQYLFNVQARNRLEQKGLLKRFSINCYGKQETMETIRAEKTERFQELKSKRGTEEYDRYFLRYIPSEKDKKESKDKKAKQTKKNDKRRTQKKGKKQQKTKNKRGKFFGYKLRL
jgi:hypothetical protein